MSRTRRLQEITELANACMELRRKERPEVLWLKKQYEIFLHREGMDRKAAADRMIFERMYGKEPENPQGILKIRYWRTGHHHPASHGQCAAFGRALGLGSGEMRFLLQGYYDSCDEIYDEEPPHTQTVYWKRRQEMERLTDQYLREVPPKRLEQMNITQSALEHSMRHLYYTDALRYICGGTSGQGQYLGSHITSINYDSELVRNRKLLGAIPRKTMIRHLIILGMPDISLDWMNRQLGFFGYLTLQDEHTLRSGERLDWLLIRLFRRYEEFCGGHSAQECFQWMWEYCGNLDKCFAEKGMNHLRFMYFKALKE